MRKYLIILMVLAVALVYAGPAIADGTPTVRTIGGLEMVPNEYIADTTRFSPGTISVPSGGTIRFLDEDEDRESPHTVTIVRRSELPQNIRELFAIFEGDQCPSCNRAGEAHFPDGEEGRPQQVVNVGRAGLNRPGDSRLFSLQGNGSWAAAVTAPPGTTLSYICVIHPWMQGEIRVTR